VLDMQIGVLSREVEWETARGHRMLVRSRRLASLEHRHLAAMDYEVVALDAAVRIAISSELVTHGPGEGLRRSRAAARASPRRCSVPSPRGRRSSRRCCRSPRATAAWSWRAGWSTPSSRRLR
jgi:alpha,alpha-trehalose phosphorylase